MGRDPDHRLSLGEVGTCGVSVASLADREAAAGTANTMPPLIEAVRAYATVDGMCDALRDVWSAYEEVPFS